MLRPYNLLTLFLFFISAPVVAQIDVESAPAGESRIRHNTSDFDIKIEPADKGQKIEIQTLLDRFSFDWVRVNELLLVPRARLKVKVSQEAKDLHLIYKQRLLNFQGLKNTAYTELFISLYEKSPIEVFFKQKLLATVYVMPKKAQQPKILIDYTCSRNSIEIDGLTHEHISIGCHTKRIGQFGKEKPMLEVMWISPELEVVDDVSKVPYHAVFLNRQPVQVNVRNRYTKEEKTITIKAKVPKRLHRMFTAYGFGPYAFNTKSTNPETDLTLKKQEPMVPALFFYLNYKISDTASVRGFDAAVFKDSNFNNAGAYLGNDFGFALDNKLYFTTLIGMQYLYFKFDEDSDPVSEAIFPQGIEFMYRHAFGITNYIVSGGIFLSTTDSIEYENAWIRWGKSYFWELNLISWAKDDIEVKTWGVSLGFPFKGFL